MNTPRSVPPAISTRYPIHAMFVQFPIVCFTLTLATDIAFWQTTNLMWQNFSAWLLFAGLVLGALAVLAAIADLLFSAKRRTAGSAWPRAFGSFGVLCLAFLNSLVHAGDGWTAVVPDGLLLSVATVLLMIVTAWFGRMQFRKQSAENQPT